jgi:hypothetical protein
MRRFLEYMALASLVVVITGFIGFSLIGGSCLGIAWDSDGRVRRALKIYHPEVEQIIHVERHIWRPSVITVEEGGQRKVYLLDSTVLQNYRFYPAD